MSEKQSKIFVASFYNTLIYFFISGILSFVLLFFRQKFLFALTGGEVRLACVFPPIFGMTFGFPGIIACTLSAFAANLLSGYSAGLCFFNVPANFLFGFVPLVVWNFVSGIDKEQRLRINSPVKFLIFALLMIAANGIVLLSEKIGFRIFSPTIDFSKEILLNFINNVFFCTMYGLPMFMTVSAIFRYAKNSDRIEGPIFSIIEKLILFFTILSVILTNFVGINLYFSLEKDFLNLMDFWINISLAQNMILFFVFASALFLLTLVVRHITKPLERMANVSRNYRSSENVIRNNIEIIGVCADYASLDSEIGELARSYVALASDMSDFIKNLEMVSFKKASYEKDIFFASQIQKTLLPQIFPTFTPCSDVDIFASIIFSKDFGGDFYDYFLIDNDHIAIITADVSGRGIEAALCMAIAKNLLKDKALAGLLPNESLLEINQQLAKDNSAGLFVSVWLGILSTATGVLQYVNAGHPNPLYMKNGQDFKFLDTPVDPVLAVSDETLYSSETLELQPGDKIVLFTKGISEAGNNSGENYGKARILEFFNEHKKIEVQELVEGLNRNVSMFIGSAAQENDFTVLALEYKKQAYKD